MKSQVKYIICYDIESGGLPTKDGKAFDKTALVELAVVVIDCQSLSVVEEKNWIVKKYKDDLVYSKEAEMVHKISEEIMESKGVDLKTVHREFKAMLLKYKNPYHKAILAGHNIDSFDNEFIENMFIYLGENLWDYSKWTFDTYLLASLSNLEQDNYKLQTCCQREGIDLIDAHRALTDTKANAELVIKYIERLRGQGVSIVQSQTEKFRHRFQL